VKSCSVEGCGYERIPQSTKYCHWHRLMRTDSDSQERERLRRKNSPGVKPKDAPVGERWCAGCDNLIPLFYCSGSRCKPCNKAARRRLVYGLSEDNHASLMRLQGGRCAICRSRQTMRALAVDHDHSTGDVRGLLCKNCNHDLLGNAHDSIRVLLAAAAYLASPPSGGGWVDPSVQGDRLMRAFVAALDNTNTTP